MRPALPAIALAVLVAVLLAVAAWLAADAGRGAPEPVDFPEDAQGVVDSSPGPALERGGELPTTLTVEVEPRALLIPPLPVLDAPCRLVAADGDAIDVPARIVAGARAAAPWARVGGRHLLAFGRPGEPASCRVVELDPEGVVEILATWREPLRGRVLDEAGAPVARAWVWAGDLDAGGAPAAVETDAEGRFALPGVLGGPGVPLVVRAAGHASRYRLLDLTRPALEPIEVTLGPAAGLDVVLGAPVPAPEAGRVGLAPADGDAALLHYPFFLAGMVGDDALAPDGTAAFDDLPAGAAVEVRVAHPALRDAPAVTVRLRRARQRAVVQGAAAPVLEGIVRAADGAPLPGVRVRAWSGGDDIDPLPAHLGRLLAPAAHAPPGATTVSGAGGGFLVGRPGADGACRVALRTAGRPGLLQQVAPGTDPVRHEFVLPDPVDFTPPPVVRVHLRPEGRQLQARRAGSTFVRWRDLEPFEVRLAEPAVVDVRVVVVGEGGEAEERRFPGLPVAGTVDLRLEL